MTMIHRTVERTRSRTPRVAAAAAPEYCSLIRSLAGQPDSPVIRSLGVTSSRGGEGVSTIALHCALAAEQLFRQPVLLVEANVGKPSLGKLLRLERGPGLGEMLLELDHREDCVQRWGDNLSAITAGNMDPRQLHRCSAESITRTIDSMQEGFRLTVWDLPAVSENQLACEMAAQLDGVLLVVESERVMTEMAEEAVARLRSAGAKVLGAVLNKERQHVPGWLAARL
jgi:protein-tyrosine kinase